MEKIFGIPAHPLFVHAPIVLIPLCALISIALVVRPSLVRAYGIPLIGLSAIGAFGAVLAAGSGEGLEELLNERSPAIREHAEWGERTRLLAVIFFVLVTAFVILVRRGISRSADRPMHTERPVAIRILAVALVLSGVAATGAVINAGHSGAKSAWEDAGSGTDAG